MKRTQQVDDSFIKAMRLEDRSLSSSISSKERGEMANIEDRLGASGIDTASRSGMSSKLDWETVITHGPKGSPRMGMMMSGRRESNVKGWTHRAKDGGRSKGKPWASISKRNLTMVNFIHAYGDDHQALDDSC